MRILFILSMFFSSGCFACEKDSEKEKSLFAKVLSKDTEELEIAVFFPKEYQGAIVNSVYFTYFPEGKFFMQVSAKPMDFQAGNTTVDLSRFSWAYIALNEKAIGEIEVLASYSWPPGPDGSVLLCGPEIRSRLSEIIKNV